MRGLFRRILLTTTLTVTTFVVLVLLYHLYFNWQAASRWKQYQLQQEAVGTKLA